MSIPKRPEVINGYTHPTNASYSKSSIYKTFNEHATKKKHMFGTVSGDPYASSSDFSTSNEDMCPVCNQVAVSNCFCVYSDKKCANNHVWYTNRTGKIITGNPHVNE